MPRLFEKRTVIPTSIERMTAFHNAPGAFARLTPPPIFMQMIHDGRTSLTDGELTFRLWFGPFPVKWTARHEAGPTPTSFADRQISGPLESWYHQHIFSRVEGGVELYDKIIFEHKSGWKGLLTRLVFDGLPLQILFLYRHWRTRQALLNRS